MRFVPGGSARGVAAMALALVVLGLAGCTADPEPIASETPTASPASSPSASPSATASVAPLTDAELLALMPEGAERSDLWGAMVTAQFFLEQYAPMFHTGDTRVWEALSADGCGYCTDALENAERVRDEGWTATGGEIVVDTAQTRASMTGDAAAVVILGTDVSRALLTNPEGATETTGKARAVEYALNLARLGERWSVVQVASESSE